MFFEEECLTVLFIWHINKIMMTKVEDNTKWERETKHIKNDNVKCMEDIN